MWADDFVFYATAEGQQIKYLTVIDEYTRGCLAIDVAGSIRSRRVAEVLSRLVSIHGVPLFMRSDTRRKSSRKNFGFEVGQSHQL